MRKRCSSSKPAKHSYSNTHAHTHTHTLVYSQHTAVQILVCLPATDEKPSCQFVLKNSRIKPKRKKEASCEKAVPAKLLITTVLEQQTDATV
eukprot:6002610-Amphidinium_carterae.1